MSPELLVSPSIAKGLPAMVRSSLANLPPQRQEEFIEEYRRQAKSIAGAYVLWFFLGWHYPYLRRWGLWVLYVLTVGGFLLWAFIDLFRIPMLVKDYNKNVAVDVMRNLKAISG